MTASPTGLVTIIIPTFNHGAWICDAVDSALRQTWPHREVIVVDDGSTDGTGALIRERYNDDVRYVYQRNRGLPAARNTGLSLATGDYIQFLDADDLLLPGKLAAHVAALTEHPECSVVYSDFAWFDGDKTHAQAPSGFEDRFRSGNVLLPLLEDNFIVVHAAMSRRADIEAVHRFDETLVACEDYDLWLRMAAAGRLFLHTPDVLVLYRRLRGSMSSSGPRQIASTIQVMERAASALPPGSEARALCDVRVGRLRELMVRALVAEAAVLLRAGRIGRATAHLARSITYDVSALIRVLRHVRRETPARPAPPTYGSGSDYAS